MIWIPHDDDLLRRGDVMDALEQISQRFGDAARDRAALAALTSAGTAVGGIRPAPADACPHTEDPHALSPGAWHFLRDSFAGQALAGMTGGVHTKSLNQHTVVGWAYQFAEAMMAKRAELLAAEAQAAASARAEA